MRAAVLEKINFPLSIREVGLSPLQIGQVLVKVLVSGLCGSQLHELNGNKGNEKFLPHLLGHEGCGIVEQIGSGVSNVKPGDKVVMHWRAGAGIDSGFPTYVMNGKEFSSGKVNTLCEYSIVSENRLTKVPSETDPEFAALLGCSFSTSLAFIENESNLKFGETVLVIGCGGLGLSLISAARLRGAGRIIAVDQVITKKDLAIKAGASEFFSSHENVQNKFDLIVDTTGDVGLIEFAISSLSGMGRFVLIGQPSPGKSICIPNSVQLFNGRGQTISATQGGGMSPQIDIPRYVQIFELGLITHHNIITHRYTLDEINLAFDTLKSGYAGRIIIKLGDIT
jgi:S-(hydroxymethyl)glutathione dehydrogenase/alcohol dehydrogenase